ncbi:MAG: glycoside hydrolase family 3 C-terminal domain-containing protein, partial [Clostridiales bacterium]|nr:glycoside hydrolase family 3 C-terminal domain-containing protein [Clostridiales bacterium]
IIVEAVGNGDITQERVDDAVLRILRVKIDAGLFDDPMLEDLDPSYDWYSDHGREVARTLACESFVPLKVGNNMTIPEGARVFVCGPAADDTGVLCGGWTITWTGYSDAEEGMEWVPYARSILESLQDVADEKGFTIVTDPEDIYSCDMVLLCLGEIPYAEWTGDTEDLSITGALAQSGNHDAINFAASTGLPTTTLLVCGRNVIISDYIDLWDSVIMCYLPGSEGGRAIADVLTGEAECGGTLPMPYYSSVEQIGTGECWHDVGWSALG